MIWKWRNKILGSFSRGKPNRRITWFVTWTRNNALTNTASACPSLKYSFKVVLNFFEYLTNSFFLCSTACFPDDPGMKPTTSFTASSSFLMALAISLKQEFWEFIYLRQTWAMSNSLYRFKEGPAIGDLVGNPAENTLQSRRFLVEFLECVFSSI